MMKGMEENENNKIQCSFIKGGLCDPDLVFFLIYIRELFSLTRLTQ